MADLFTAVVEENRLCPDFRLLRDSPGWECARKMLSDVYEQFSDPEGNFLEQFQTTGFNARFFELYLFAYFSRSGFAVDRGNVNPDFIVTRGDLTVAVEATTLNPSTSGVLKEYSRKFSELRADEIDAFRMGELCMRFGSALSSKMKKRYWALAHCTNLPFVIAVEAFFDPEALFLSDTALSAYAYGLSQSALWSPDAELIVQDEELNRHVVGAKEIPSKFFGQPETEHVSAIIFTNSGSNGKFARMGFQTGYGSKTVSIVRTGLSFNPHPDAMDPTLFSYSLDSPPFVESWGQGMVVLHNPSCLHPIDREFFVDAAQGYITDGRYASDVPRWHPFTSRTTVYNMGLDKNALVTYPGSRHQYAIAAVPRDVFRSLCGFFIQENPLMEEGGWFSDDSESFIGVVLRDKVDNDWGWVVLARDRLFKFRAIDQNASLPTRRQAVSDLFRKMAHYLSESKRIFYQD